MIKGYTTQHSTHYKIKCVLLTGHDYPTPTHYVGETSINITGSVNITWTTKENAWLYNALETVLLCAHMKKSEPGLKYVPEKYDD